MSEKIEHELEKILEFSQVMIFIIYAEGIFLQVSAASYSILGHKPDEMVRQSYKEYLHSDDLAISEQAILEVMDKGMCKLDDRYRH
ncbi:PAS domain S-box protein [Mucilaginibacter phyllosphaerae]